MKEDEGEDYCDDRDKIDIHACPDRSESLHSIIPCDETQCGCTDAEKEHVEKIGR